MGGLKHLANVRKALTPISLSVLVLMGPTSPLPHYGRSLWTAPFPICVNICISDQFRMPVLHDQPWQFITQGSALCVVFIPFVWAPWAGEHIGG